MLSSDDEENSPPAKKAKTETSKPKKEKRVQPKLDPKAKDDDVFIKGTISGSAHISFLFSTCALYSNLNYLNYSQGCNFPLLVSC